MLHFQRGGLLLAEATGLEVSASLLFCQGVARLGSRGLGSLRQLGDLLGLVGGEGGEPPCTEPYAGWCGSGELITPRDPILPLVSIRNLVSLDYLSGWNH
jgi:hypothetical protein